MGSCQCGWRSERQRSSHFMPLDLLNQPVYELAVKDIRTNCQQVLQPADGLSGWSCKHVEDIASTHMHVLEHHPGWVQILFSAILERARKHPRGQPLFRSHLVPGFIRNRGWQEQGLPVTPRYIDSPLLHSSEGCPRQPVCQSFRTWTRGARSDCRPPWS